MAAICFDWKLALLKCVCHMAWKSLIMQVHDHHDHQEGVHGFTLWVSVGQSLTTCFPFLFCIHYKPQRTSCRDGVQLAPTNDMAKLDRKQTTYSTASSLTMPRPWTPVPCCPARDCSLHITCAQVESSRLFTLKWSSLPVVVYWNWSVMPTGLELVGDFSQMLSLYL